MGIAWFDDEPPPMGEVALRTGGLPLLPEHTHWPSCRHCALPMLFRAQLPLSLTSLVAFDDPRVLLAFECHATEGCDEAEVLIVAGVLSLRTPPIVDTYDIVIRALGEHPSEVSRLIALVAEHPSSALSLPATIARGIPSSIASEAARSIESAGGRVELRPHPRTLLNDVHGGQLIPFDDDIPGTHKTTLPPLAQLAGSSERSRMRGLIGGVAPGYRDRSSPCSCGRHTRTAARLLGDTKADDSGIRLLPRTLQVCLKCDRGFVSGSSSKPRPNHEGHGESLRGGREPVDMRPSWRP